MIRAYNPWPPPKSIYLVDPRFYGDLLPRPSPDADHIFRGIRNTTVGYKIDHLGLPLTPLEIKHNIAYGDMLRIIRKHFITTPNVLPIFKGLPGVSYRPVTVTDWFDFKCYYWWEDDKPVPGFDWSDEIIDPDSGIIDPERVSQVHRVPDPGYDIFEIYCPRHQDLFQSYRESPYVRLRHPNFNNATDSIKIRASPKMFSDFPMIWGGHILLHPLLMRRIAHLIDPRFLLVLRWDLADTNNPTLTELDDLSHI